MRAAFVRSGLTLVLVSVIGCATAEIPQAYRGWEFSRTGFWKFYAGGKGFTGPVLNPGSYYTGPYNDIMMVDCSIMTAREPLAALTRDGVQFGLDVYVRFSAECSDDSVKLLLSSLTPDKNGVITTHKFYETFVRPAIGEAVRQVVSPYRANDLNEKREELLGGIRDRVFKLIAAKEGKSQVIIVHEVNLSNLDFPDTMDQANVERAVQAIMKDKAIAERERVQAEIETMRIRKKLAQTEGETVAAKIDKIGEALRRNPDYLRYDMQMKMPEIYREAGRQGNMVITAPNPSIVVGAKTDRGGAPIMKPTNQNAPKGNAPAHIINHDHK